MSGPHNPLSMSDEDFLKLNDPSQVPGADSVEKKPEEEEEANEASGSEEGLEEQQEEEAVEGEAEEAGEEEVSEEAEEGSDDEAKPADGGAVEAGVASEEEASVEEKEQKKEPVKQETLGVPSDLNELQQFYGKVMAPFKANGKTIQAKTPEEVMTLMQMGANYTKKMQDIQPHRKVLMLLEDNGLLDQGQLSFLVDVAKHDPAAIKKLLKEANIDPLDIDMDSDPEYLGGNHLISDQQANFREVVQEVAQSDSGKETLQIIDKWDDASKDAVWESPELIQVIQSQRDNGVYDQIVSELDRQKTLGSIPANLPFLQAYKLVGDQLFSPANTTPQKVKVAEKVAKPKPKVSNGDKASAAAPSRSTPRKTGQVVNPLAMSDEEFAKLAGIQI